MKIFTFEQTIKKVDTISDPLRFDPVKQNTIYDILDFRLYQLNFKRIGIGTITVSRQNIGRLDLVSQELYGSTDYTEELMLLNNMCNPYSINEGDLINYVLFEDLTNLQKPVEPEDTAVKNALVNGSKDSKIDPARGNLLPPTVKPDGASKMNINTSTNTIEIPK